MFISDYLQLNDEQLHKFADKGVFDALADKDSHFFINIIRLRESSVPEFIGAYKHLNDFFFDVATLLNAADKPTMKDKMYRTARKKFAFHEVNGICLGLSKNRYGNGWGKVLSDRFCYDAYQIVKKGSLQPELFHLVSLFEDQVAGDRLSDMIATIIEPDIMKYTLRIMSELGINKSNNPKMDFRSDGLIQNKFRNSPIYLLSQDILHEIPIARDWDDIDRVVSENESIRREISFLIGKEWEKWQSEKKKEFIKQHVFMNPEVCARVIEEYRKEEIDKLNIKENSEYLAALFMKYVLKETSFKAKKELPTSFEATMDVIEILKDWIENKRGWVDIHNSPSRSREKAVQRFMQLSAAHYVNVNDLDISPECDSGRGPVDIKLSRGNDKTLAEIKLSSNDRYLHGYQMQIEEYGKAEHTRNLIYVFVDVDYPRRLKTLKTLHRENISKGIKCPELVIIDARPKKAASTYNECKVEFDSLEYDFGDCSEISLDEIKHDIGFE